MKFSIVSVCFLLSILFFTHKGYSQLTCPSPVPSQYQDAKPGNIVAAYFASWDTYGKNKYEVNDIEPVAHKLTHVKYAFAKPNAITGKCELLDPWADVRADLERRTKLGGNFAKLIELKKKFPHLKILLSIGGGADSKSISEIARKGMTDTFIQSCVDILDSFTYQFVHSKTGNRESILFEYPELFDGIDFDWEWLNNNVPPADAAAFEKIILSLRQLLNDRAKRVKRKALLTVAIQPNAKVYKALPLGKVVNAVDWFNLMAYNFATSGGHSVGFNAPLCNQWVPRYGIDHVCNGLMSLGIPPGKIVLGIPLYGHVYDQAQEKIGSPFKQTGVTGALTYDLIKARYLNNDACHQRWDAVSKVPYVYCPADKLFVSFDNQKSVQEKYNFAQMKSLGGVVFWKLSGDDDQHSLVHVVNEL